MRKKKEKPEIFEKIADLLDKEGKRYEKIYKKKIGYIDLKTLADFFEKGKEAKANFFSVSICDESCDFVLAKANDEEIDELIELTIFAVIRIVPLVNDPGYYIIPHEDPSECLDLALLLSESARFDQREAKARFLRRLLERNEIKIDVNPVMFEEILINTIKAYDQSIELNSPIKTVDLANDILTISFNNTVIKFTTQGEHKIQIIN